MDLDATTEKELIAAWRRDLEVFGFRVLKAYGGWLAGVCVSTVGFVGQRFAFGDAPAAWWGIAIAGVLISCFQVWRSEKARGDALHLSISQFQQVPISARVFLDEQNDWVCVKITNRGDMEVPIQGMVLHLDNGAGRVEPIRVPAFVENAPAIRHTMRPKTNFTVEGLLPAATLAFWGIKSVFAVVSLQDEREVRSEPFALPERVASRTFAAEEVKGLTWQQCKERWDRIIGFYDRYLAGAASNSNRRHSESPLCFIADARVLELKADDEIKSAFRLLSDAGHATPFLAEDWEKGIRQFFEDHWGHGISPGRLDSQLAPLFLKRFGHSLTSNAVAAPPH